MGKYITSKIDSLKGDYPIIKNVRGKGLMLGIELDIDGNDLTARCRQNGLLINCTQGNILRVFPPMNVTEAEIDEAMHIFEKSLKEVSR